MAGLQTNKRAYRPRRVRSGNPPPFQVTPRDVAILRAVARYRFLNSAHICRLIPGSDKNMRDCLKGLFEHGLLDRPECQYDFYRPGGGSSLAVYALADAGARLLLREDGSLQGQTVSWSHKNRTVGRPFLEHTLAIADFAVALRVDVRPRDDIELLDGPELVARMPPATRALAKPFRLTVPVIFKGARHSVTVEPDYAFSLGFPEKKRRANFLVEIDRGTMPVARADLEASSILKKLLAYDALWRAKVHTTQLAWRNFRVLMVTTDAERMEHMRRCLRRQSGGKASRLFWFAQQNGRDWSALLTDYSADGEENPRTLARTP